MSTFRNNNTTLLKSFLRLKKFLFCICVVPIFAGRHQAALANDLDAKNIIVRSSRVTTLLADYRDNDLKQIFWRSWRTSISKTRIDTWYFYIQSHGSRADSDTTSIGKVNNLSSVVCLSANQPPDDLKETQWYNRKLESHWEWYGKFETLSDTRCLL